jgi:MFS family permease
VACLISQRKEVKKSLKYSVLDGSAYSAMQGLTQDYIAPFALALRATIAQIGLLCSVPSLAMALSQLAAPHLAERAGSRKGLILPVVLIHALMWVPILLVPYLFPSHKVWWLIGFFTMSTVFSSLGNPAWGSMMADLVPEGLRGRYFGLRGKICGLIALTFFFIGGIILHLSSTEIFLGFSIIFGGAMLFRLVSWYFLSRMYEPPLSKVKGNHHSLINVVMNLGSSNLGRFTVYVSLMNFATYLAAPFFAVYMLRELKFDYLTYVAVTAAAVLANLMFLTFWGGRADRAGNIKVLRVTSIIVPLVPLLWIGSHQLYYLIPVQILSGFAWAGFNLASANFLYDASAPENRTRCIALFNTMNGVTTCLGSLLGGYLALRLPPLLGYSLLTLFLVSGLLRGLVAAIFLRRISEVRRVPEITNAELLFGRLSFAGVGVRNVAQPVFHLISQFKAEKVSSISRWDLAWWHELATASRSPPI